MSTQKIGIIGMAVMGKNLALNIENHGYRVSIYNRSRSKIDEIISKNSNKKLIPYYNIEEFINSLEIPRRILLMVQSGKVIDQTIKIIKPFLQKGDILIDGGNSFYKDTIRRHYKLLKEGFNFIGAGISGGEEGALKGPSIMPGGQKKSYDIIAPIFKQISAKSDGEDCVTYIGPDGSGHYVKMVHNGIEYGYMQLISESYALLKIILNLNNKQLSNIFNEWNKGELNSYLIKITSNILEKKDEQENFLLDFILDQASNKGTGKWSSQNSLDLGVPLNLITESVFARYLSSIKKQRIVASKILTGPKIKILNYNNKFIEHIRQALYFGKMISYIQGFSQLKYASEKNNWNLNYEKIAKIFKSGCIIQSQILKKISDAYINNSEIVNLLLNKYFQNIADKYQQSLRYIVNNAIKQGIPVPTLSSAISYYDSYRSALLPANLIQAQRDYFGAHTYKRIDKKGKFHTIWI